MKLLELLDQQDLETAYYDPAQDQANIITPNMTRRPILSLRAINRLKRIRALRKLEALKQEDLLSVMYATPEEGEMGMGMGMGGQPPAF